MELTNKDLENINKVGYLIDSAILGYEISLSSDLRDFDDRYVDLVKSHPKVGLTKVINLMYDLKLTTTDLIRTRRTKLIQLGSGHYGHQSSTQIEFSLIDKEGKFYKVSIDESFNFCVDLSDGPIYLIESESGRHVSDINMRKGIVRYIHENYID